LPPCRPRPARAATALEKAIEDYRSDGGYELPGVALNTIAA
jgi:hypothetical protein